MLAVFAWTLAHQGRQTVREPIPSPCIISGYKGEARRFHRSPYLNSFSEYDPHIEEVPSWLRVIPLDEWREVV